MKKGFENTKLRSLRGSKHCVLSRHDLSISRLQFKKLRIFKISVVEKDSHILTFFLDKLDEK